MSRRKDWEQVWFLRNNGVYFDGFKHRDHRSKKKRRAGLRNRLVAKYREKEYTIFNNN